MFRFLVDTREQRRPKKEKMNTNYIILYFNTNIYFVNKRYKHFCSHSLKIGTVSTSSFVYFKRKQSLLPKKELVSRTRSFWNEFLSNTANETYANQSYV